MSGDLFGLAQALCALTLLGALVWVVRRAGFGVLGARKGRLLEIEERLPLDLRSGLLIVRAEGRRLLLATSDHGPARLLLELTPGSSPSAARAVAAGGEASAGEASAGEASAGETGA